MNSFRPGSHSYVDQLSSRITENQEMEEEIKRGKEKMMEAAEEGEKGRNGRG
jgi:hypothetical protein